MTSASSVAQGMPDRYVYRFPQSQPQASGALNRTIDRTEAVKKILSSMSQIHNHAFCIRQSVEIDINIYATEFTEHDRAQLDLTLREIREVSSRNIEHCEVAMRRIRDWNSRADRIARKADAFLQNVGWSAESDANNEQLIERRIERAVQQRADEAKRAEEELHAKYATRRSQYEAEFAERRSALLRKYAELYGDVVEESSFS